jgi:hypothetical protein
METADVRRRVHEAIARAKRGAAERRAAADRAAAAFEALLEHTAVPLVRQIASVLRADGYPFTAATPSGSVRLTSDRSAEDFVEILLDSSGGRPQVTGRVSRARGRRVVEREEIIGRGDPASVSEDDLLGFLLKAIEPFVER